MPRRSKFSEIGVAESHFTPTCFTDLPTELAEYILKWLPAFKIISLRRLSKGFNTYVLSNISRLVPRKHRLVTESSELSEWEEVFFNVPDYFACDIAARVFENIISLRWNDSLPGRKLGVKGCTGPKKYRLSAIPTSIGLIYSLRILHLNNCSLRGQIPSSLYSLLQLKVLGLGHNELTGDIDVRIGDLADLEELWLQHNDFTGTIPKEIGKCEALKIFQIFGNRFTGCIPVEIGKCKNLVMLEVGLNELYGNIPKEIFLCSKLRYFGAAQNQFTGSVPREILGCSSLGIFEIYANKHYLFVPREIKRLRFFKRNGGFENTALWKIFALKKSK
ncbi:hypothetical protein HK100_003144 [Physocladia obscura]|uniref:F-box domain-containing protein n=1 Tax=Physocladia obscura TaxID=109957 RepID=A0AAD5SUI3_9FUNG|nr:hypothetical protein HK100_003144 [Physocladia obscura]